MKVAFVTSGYENLGIEHLSSCLKARGHDVRLFFDPQTFGGVTFLSVPALKRALDLKDKLTRMLLAWNPDIVGFSCMTHSYPWCLDIARRVKAARPDVPVIFGGIHATSVPERVLAHDCVDMVAMGESEEAFPALLDTFDGTSFKTDVPGFYFKHGDNIIRNPMWPLIREIESIPYPDKALFFDKVPAYADYGYNTMASRGCPYACTYCCNDLLRRLYDGKIFRRIRSVDHLIEELRQAKERFGIRRVWFYDEVFPANLEWLEEFSEKYKKTIDLPFNAFYHFQIAKDAQMKLLTEAGCRQINFGLQSASERVRCDICNRRHSNDDVRQAVEVCRKYGVEIQIDHIFGLPTETLEETRQAVAFYRELRPNIVYAYWLTYYPKTSIIDKALEEGLLTQDDVEQIEEGRESYLHAGTHVRNRKELLKYQLLFDLIPLLPRRIHERLADRDGLLRWLPKNYFWHFFLIFLASLKLDENPLIRKLKLTFSRKRVP